ncbi:MAG: DEAD/DEAH box helicase [Actinomycetes bacterium]
MTSTTPHDPTFADLGLPAPLVAVLDELGYEEPTPIQREAIPPALASRDVLGQAATGTGKTAAFALPTLARLVASRDEGRDDARGRAPLALVLVPTRELAMQVSEAVHTYGRRIGARVLPVYGGQPIVRQLKALKAGVDVVVATPGRALDHLRRGTLDLAALEVVVLDEADEMLDLGFAEELEELLGATPEYHQTMLFSATMPRRIADLARTHLHEPVRVTIDRQEAFAGESPRIREVVYVVSRHHKPAALGRVLDVESPTATIVFCRTRTEVDELTATMNGRGYRAEGLHGGLDQPQRDRVLGRLRDGTTELLVATDVAARGLDIDVLSHVVNYALPTSPESYVHRVGRVGRAGREGVAVSLVEPREHRALKAIEKHTGRRMEVESVPTVADLHARRLELLRATVRESLLQDDLDAVRPVVESLADEFDLVDIALAALTALHDERTPDADEVEVPDASLAGGKGSPTATPAGRKGYKHADGDTTNVWVSIGRQAGVRPADLVGAIANETSLSGKDVGNIVITGKFSLVEVPSRAADEVIRTLREATVRGKRVHAKRDRST